jgi:hypothetical protein
MMDKNLLIPKEEDNKVELMAVKIAKESPELKDLTTEQL